MNNSCIMGAYPGKPGKVSRKTAMRHGNMEEQAQKIGLYQTGSKMLVDMMLVAGEDAESKDSSKPCGLQSTCGCDTQAGGLQRKE